MPTDQVIGEVDSAQVSEQEAIDTQVEAEQDAALRSILGTENTENTETTDTKPEPKTEEHTEPVPDSVNAADLKKAKATLNRDRVPKSALKNLTDKEIVDWGTQRATEQGKQDGYGNQLKDLKAQLTKATAKKAAEDIDFSEAVKPLAEKLKAIYGDEELDSSTELQSFAKEIFQVASAASQARSDEQTQQIEKLVLQFEDSQRNSARNQLPKHYGLDSDDRWQDVVDYRLADANEYPSEKAAMEAACRQVFADETIAKYETNQTDQHKARSQGSSTTDKAGNAPPASKTEEEAVDDVIRGILRGDDDMKARGQKKLGRTVNQGFNELMSEERIGV